MADIEDIDAKLIAVTNSRADRAWTADAAALHRADQAREYDTSLETKLTQAFTELHGHMFAIYNHDRRPSTRIGRYFANRRDMRPLPLRTQFLGSVHASMGRIMTGPLMDMTGARFSDDALGVQIGWAPVVEEEYFADSGFEDEVRTRPLPMAAVYRSTWDPARDSIVMNLHYEVDFENPGLRAPEFSVPPETTDKERLRLFREEELAALNIAEGINGVLSRSY